MSAASRKYHPRCGTSFMFVLIIIATIVSSIVFSIIDITNPFLRMLAHLILLPLVVGISYEFNRYAGPLGEPALPRAALAGPDDPAPDRIRAGRFHD